MVTGLHFTTSSEFPTNPPPTNVDVTLTDLTRTLAIYQATLALPVPPPGLVGCGSDPGYRHTITFFDGEVVKATAVLISEGCQYVTISGSSTTRQTTEAYWNLLAQNLGVSEASFFSLASTTAQADGGTCQYPPNVSVRADGGVTAAGCFAGPSAQICDGVNSCRPICDSSQYEMSCYDGSSLDAALGCQIIPIPTPSNVLFYCCPCAN
jgi:hypothetical protein